MYHRPRNFELFLPYNLLALVLCIFGSGGKVLFVQGSLFCCMYVTSCVLDHTHRDAGLWVLLCYYRIALNEYMCFLST